MIHILDSDGISTPIDPHQRVAAVGATQPDASITRNGDLWYDTGNSVLKLWNGSSWVDSVSADTTRRLDAITTAVTHSNDSSMYPTVGTLTIPGGTLGTTGSVVAEWWGHWFNDTGASRTHLMRITLGGTVIWNDVPPTHGPGSKYMPWNLRMEINAVGDTQVQKFSGHYCTQLVTGTVSVGHGDANPSTAPLTVPINGDGSEDSTGDLDIDLDIWLLTASASYGITIDYARLMVTT